MSVHRHAGRKRRGVKEGSEGGRDFSLGNPPRLRASHTLHCGGRRYGRRSGGGVEDEATEGGGSGGLVKGRRGVKRKMDG